MSGQKGNWVARAVDVGAVKMPLYITEREINSKRSTGEPAKASFSSVTGAAGGNCLWKLVVSKKRLISNMVTL